MRAPAFWSNPPEAPGVLARLLSPFGCLYALATARRIANATPWRAPVPVICIGNITAGGTGKTPTALAIAERLIARGIALHFVTRGHGGREEGPHRVDIHRDDAGRVGDEPLLLAAIAPTWVAKDRAAGAKAAVEAGAEAIILDDGHQNPGVAKDLSIVVVDGGAGFGNGYCIPAGPLREPIETGLARASAVALIGEGEVATPGLPQGSPVLRARLQPRATGLSLEGAKVIAFAGIGRPEKFFETVRSLGAEIVNQVAFPDHAPFAPQMLKRMEAEAALKGALLVTTEKDAARMPAWFRGKAATVPVVMAFEDESALEELLDRIVPRRGESAAETAP